MERKSNDPSNNYGTSNELYLDGDDPPGSGNDKSAILKWDISSIPSGSTVTAASIILSVTDKSDDAYKLYEMKRDWVGTEATWNVYSSGNNWQLPAPKAPTIVGQQSWGRYPPASQVHTLST